MVQKNCLSFKPVILIGGTTAVGKSEMALKLAKEFNGEIISADSMQIYKNFNVGTNKIKKSEMQGIKHHLIDFHDGKDFYSVAQFKEDATKCIEKILAENKIPIVVGGTGLYLNSLLFNYSFTGKNQKVNQNVNYKFFPIVVEMERDKLYQKINLRVDQMIKNGLIDEIKSLIKLGYSFESVSFRAIGYKEFKPYFNGEMALEECVNKLKQNTRNYAKRQITWFKQWKEFALYVQNYDEISMKLKDFLKNGFKFK